MTKAFDPRAAIAIIAEMSRAVSMILGIGILFVGPIAVLTGGWFLLETYPGRPDVTLSPLTTYILSVVSLAVGVVGIWMLPIRPLFRYVLIPPYLAGMWMACFAVLAVLDCATVTGCH
jgi:hypothetical protein